MATTSPSPAAPTPGPAWRPPVRRMVVAVVLAVAVALLLHAPLPGYVITPGPVFPLADQITVEGADPINGDYLFTTIRVDSATVVGALGASLDPQAQVVTRRALLRGEDEAAFVARQDELFEESGSLAVALAIEAVGSDLDPADVVLSDDGTVGGPSAGLLTALAVADVLSPLDLADGRLVSGTGAVTDDGTVTDVGSVADKIEAAQAAGVDLFLLPSGLLEAARATGTDMALVGVDNVAEAIAVLSAR